MYRKYKTLIALALIANMFIFSSCSDDDENLSAPEINDMEIGTSDSHIGVLGSDLHTEAELVAEAKINEVIVEINKESGDGWDFDTTFTEFSGYKNYTYHKHIDIPLSADTGVYVFTFTVTDMEGQETVLEDNLTIQEPTDSVSPSITVSSAPSDGATYNNGETITISGTVTDETSLGGIYIGLVREDQNLTDSEVNATNTITILHNHDFEDPESYSFSSSIVVGASEDNNITPKEITDDADYAWKSANYYIVVKCKDSYGGNWTFSDHYPIVINY
jgi:hypothetical protein